MSRAKSKNSKPELTVGARVLLDRVAIAVPYTLRYERTAEALVELNATLNLCEYESVTVRDVMRLVCLALPTGWQATKRPGRVILYREDVDAYPGAEIIARSA